jgi:lysozyme
MSAAKIMPKVVWVAALGGFVTLLSPDLVDHLQKWESGPQRALIVYADKLAGGLPTVCNGLTRHVTRTPIVVGERWAPEKCVVEEANALERVQRDLLACFKRLPPPSVLDMGSSHAWNFGAQATCGSGAMAAWNRGEWERGCQRISRGDDGRMVWSFTSHIDPATGKKVFTFVQGLANRRADEATKCAGGLA